MKDKLQPGDYVTDLTKEQFDELISIEGHAFKLSHSDKNNGSVCFDGKKLMHAYTYKSIEICKLTFEEFLRRAKNTFR